MKLLTKELKKRIPPLSSQEYVEDPIVVTKFFTPDSSWTWYVLEGSYRGIEDGKEKFFPLSEKGHDQDDVMFFGLVDGHEEEMGYFTLREMAKVKGPMGLPIERDLYWKPRPLSEVGPERGIHEDHPGQG